MTDPVVTIEPVADRHLEQFQAAVDSVARERLYLGTVEGFPLEQVRQFTDSIASAGGVQLVALAGGRVVGWCDIRRSPFEGFRHVGTLGVGLLPQWREQGLGRRLIQAAVDAASREGVTRIELEVFASNSRAVHDLHGALAVVTIGSVSVGRIRPRRGNSVPAVERVGVPGLECP